MNKAIILTNVQLTQQQINQLQQTQTLKVALNHHAQNLNPTMRWTSDYIATKLKNKYGADTKIYSNRDNNAIKVAIPHTGYSIVDCARWLKSKGYTVLLVADNTVHSKQAQDTIKQLLKDVQNVYKFTKNGNFDLPYKDIKEYV
jgi:hypothetical protein